MVFRTITASLVAVAAFFYAFDFPFLGFSPFQVLKNGSDAWDVFQHLGGYSPWIRKERGVLKGGIEVPEGCIVDQVHMLSRHAERYPTVTPGIRELELYQRLQSVNHTFKGDLAFVNEWDFYAPHPNEQFEQLTSTGPYAGTLQSFATGVRLRTRYERLLEHALAHNHTTFWASGSDRVIETARLFATGFYGTDWEQTASLIIIPETRDRGADTLTPGRACPNYATDPLGHSHGMESQMAFRSTYLPAISQRLGEQNPEVTFTESEIYSMQEMCGFETLAKGHTKWCDIFTRDEMLSFENARDVLHYYRAGPGNKFGPSMGWLWLQATAALLEEGPEAGQFFFSFNHDGDIIAMLSALDMFPQNPPLPTDRILHNRIWRTSDITPMGGRIIFERLSCPAQQECWDNSEYGYPNHLYCTPPRNHTFVRININDGIVPLPDCTDGIASSCPLDKFLQKIQKRGEELMPFADLCSLSEDAPKRIAFLRQ